LAKLIKRLLFKNYPLNYNKTGYAYSRKLSEKGLKATKETGLWSYLLKNKFSWYISF